MTSSKGQSPQLTVSVTSFSYKWGVPADPSPHGGGFVFDCRCIQNPGREPHLKPKTGLDLEVRNYLDALASAQQFRSNIVGLIEIAIDAYIKRGFEHLSVSFGCTGGQHRSVYFSQYLHDVLAKRGDIKVKLSHREIEAGRAPDKDGELK
jgi:RNase adaptor protein for sRNA GlmZ degradation